MLDADVKKDEADHIQDLLEDVEALADVANETEGVAADDIAEIYALIEEAADLALWAEEDSGAGFHNPDFVKAKLFDAIQKLWESIVMTKFWMKANHCPNNIERALQLVCNQSIVYGKNRECGEVMHAI